ncbi:hypothetical protein [Aliarcobacter butzleri]|uniref:hypothetical protein n=1 Tax=Aliarcobacter butzleri TaxID=28197 RepID=UPI001EDD6AC8|nr:hypothetical protein [Aliarcobacter butzleri]
MKIFKILSSTELQFFCLKINQKIINYKKNHMLVIILKYYYRIIKALLKKDFIQNAKSVVISNSNLNDSNSYLRKYDSYVKYENCSLSKLQFFNEFIRMPLFILEYLNIKSNYRNQIFEAYLYSRIITNNLKKSQISQVIFFGSDYSLIFLFATLVLNKKGIETIHYCDAGYLAEHNLMVSSKIYCRTDIQKDYIQQRRDIFFTDKVYSFNIRSVSPANKINNITKQRKIAVYSSGYYARFKRNVATGDNTAKGLRAEEEMINILKQFALAYKHVEITLFLHLHNNIENIADGKKHFHDFLMLDNVRIQEENENSIENFFEYELGICHKSEIFFDRYERGYKTILIGRNSNFNDFINRTSLINVIIEGDDINAPAKIDKFLHMDVNEYFSLLNNKEEKE